MFKNTTFVQEEIMSQGDTLHDLVDIRDVAAVQMALRGGNGVPIGVGVNAMNRLAKGGRVGLV